MTCQSTPCQSGSCGRKRGRPQIRRQASALAARCPLHENVWPTAPHFHCPAFPLPRIPIAPHFSRPTFLSPHISLALYGRLQPWAFIRVRTCLTLELPVLGTFHIGKCPYSEMSVSGPVLPASEFFTHNDWSTIIDPKLLTRVWCPTVQGPKLVAQTFQPDHGDPMPVSCVRFMTTS